MDAPPVPPATPAVPDEQGREREALRIQAAAVAAQQAALVEEESRLSQRRQALERQEAQLAAHLEERRRHLLRVRAGLRRAQAALRGERQEHEKRIEEAVAALGRARKQVTTGQDLLTRERQRLLEMRRRLRRRHARHWDVRRTDLERREAALAEARRRLEDERAAWEQARLRGNAEVELAKRQQQDGWAELRRARADWEKQRVREEDDLLRRGDGLDAAGRALAAERDAWAKSRRALQDEIGGLENRVRNLRRALSESPREAGRPDDAVAPAAPGARAVPAATPGHVADLGRLADELHDQRLHVAEQMGRLVDLRRTWHEEQSEALARLEEAARRLDDREQGLVPREAALAEAGAEINRREAEAARRRALLDAREARLSIERAAWDAERAERQADLSGREDDVRRRAERLTALHRRWLERTRELVGTLRVELAQCGEARRQYAARWGDYLERGAELERRLRAAAERELALEQLRLEVIGRARHSAAAEKRLERLRRRCAATLETAARRLVTEREALASEGQRLEEQAHQVMKRVADLAGREEGLARQWAAWEETSAVAEVEQARCRAEVRVLTARSEASERQARELNEEVERLARALLDDEPATLPFKSVAA